MRTFSSVRWLALLLLAGCGGASERYDGTGGTSGSDGTAASGGASSAGRGGAGASGGQGGSGTAGASGQTGDYFITAEVDGITVRAAMNANASWRPGLLDSWLSVDATAEPLAWNLLVLNATGVESCSYMVLYDVSLQPNLYRGSFTENGSCTVTLQRAAFEVGDVLEGTFSGAIATLGGAAPGTVTNGRFRVPTLVLSD